MGLGGDDRLFGEDGDDRLFGGAGVDYIDGGAGSDRLYFFQLDLFHGVVVDLLNGLIVDDGFGTQDRVFSVEDVSGSEYADTIYGSNAANELWGSHGTDYLFGGNGADFLNGGDGDDTLEGGRHRDRLGGDAGNDVFVITPDDMRAGDIQKVSEIIVDFRNTGGERDRIDLRSIDAIEGGGDDRFTWIGGDEFSQTPGELRFELISNHIFIFGDVDGDGAFDVSIKLGGNGNFMSISANDFYL